MQTRSVAVSFASDEVPSFPGRTPTPVRADPTPASVTEAAGGTPVRLAVDDPRPATPQGQHWAMEGLEDASLLLVLVFALPIVIMLLAVPFAVVLRVAAMMAAR